MVRSRRRRTRGFTLIELMISMALAIVGLLGLMALQVTATRGNASSRSYMEAVSIAQERIEMAEVAQYLTISTAVPAEGACGLPLAAPPALITGTTVTPTGAPAGYPTFTRCTIVTVNALANTTYVQVTVQWIEYNTLGGTPHTVTMSTTRSP